jgi:hypothetical protein
MEGLIKEAKNIMKGNCKVPMRDAEIIITAQKVAL